MTHLVENVNVKEYVYVHAVHIHIHTYVCAYTHTTLHYTTHTRSVTDNVIYYDVIVSHDCK